MCLGLSVKQNKCSYLCEAICILIVPRIENTKVILKDKRPAMPAKGPLELEVVLDSPYMFA